MSIQHSAWIFDYALFDTEFSDILYDALESGESQSIRKFMHQNYASMTNFWTEESLEKNWEELEELIDPSDVVVMADYALTKYYNLTDDMGLSYGFDALGAYLENVPTLNLPLGVSPDYLICGKLFGPKGKRLDPGGMEWGWVYCLSQMLQKR